MLFVIPALVGRICERRLASPPVEMPAIKAERGLKTVIQKWRTYRLLRPDNSESRIALANDVVAHLSVLQKLRPGTTLERYVTSEEYCSILLDTTPRSPDRSVSH